MDGSFLIGARAVTSDTTFEGIDPATNDTLDTAFAVSSPENVAEACALADAAFDAFRETDPADRATFLETIASEIEAIGEELVARAILESGLPRPRLEGERGRTTGQLRMFAKLLRQGRYTQVTIDSALPDRTPLPRSDLRQRRIAVGPVAVFGASNFPLAFSVAGGDTASALAAGCPVVVKGHPAHPGATVMVARAIQAAVANAACPKACSRWSRVHRMHSAPRSSSIRGSRRSASPDRARAVSRWSSSPTGAPSRSRSMPR